MLQWKEEFTAWITIDGKEAVEYDVQTSEDDKTVTCWIASELGKKFAIYWKNTSDYAHDLLGATRIDGNDCGGIVCLYDQDVGQILRKSGVYGVGTVQPFIFSSLELTDDDDALQSSSTLSLQDLGLIELIIYPFTKSVPVAPTVPSRYSLSDLKIHERSKKAVTQQITLAAPEPQQGAVKTWNSRRAGRDIVKFCFKYRPMDVLRANGTAPSPPQLKRKASAELPREQTPDDSEELAALEEVKTLREKLQTLEAKLQTKREKKPRIKDEDGDVIDLTQNTSRSKKGKGDAKRPFISGR